MAMMACTPPQWWIPFLKQPIEARHQCPVPELSPERKCTQPMVSAGLNFFEPLWMAGSATDSGKKSLERKAPDFRDKNAVDYMLALHVSLSPKFQYIPIEQFGHFLHHKSKIILYF